VDDGSSRAFPSEGYAEDIVAHCDTEVRACLLRAAIADRLGAPGLELHPRFDLIGCTFRARLARVGQGRDAGSFTAFPAPRRQVPCPAASP
jgi:hypothetical protein